jgi:hypothetical protein
MKPRVAAPITVALVNDYDIVVMGMAHILEQYGDRVVIAELDTNKPVSDMVDIALYDSFAQPCPACCGLHLELRPRAHRERPQARRSRIFVKGITGARPGIRPGSDPCRRDRDQ